MEGTSAPPIGERRGAGRFEFIDAIRGIAAMAVVIEHAVGSYYGSQLTESWPFSFGQFGVAAFLFVSGFVVPVSLERTQSARKFWTGRFFRLYPLYWFSLLAAAPLLLSEAADKFNPHNPVHWLANVTMLQQFAGLPHALGVYWTLTLEMALYATFTVLFWTGALSKSLRNAWWVLGAAAVVAVIIPFLLNRRLPGGSSGAYVFYFLTAFVGTVGYRWHTGKATTKEFATLMTAAAAVGAGIAYVLYDRLRSDKVPMSFAGALATWITAYIFIVAMLELRNCRIWPWLLWIGRISYSIYLLHFLALHFMPKSMPFWLYCSGVSLGTLAISSVTYLAIEAPSDALGKRLQGRPKP